MELSLNNTGFQDLSLISHLENPLAEECILHYVLHNKELDRITNSVSTWYFNNPTRKKAYFIAYDYIINQGRGLLNIPAYKDLLRIEGFRTEDIDYIGNVFKANYSSFPELDYSIAVLRNLGRQRRFIETMSVLSKEAQKKDAPMDKILSDAEDTLFSIEKSDGAQLEVLIANPEKKTLEMMRKEALIAAYLSKGIYSGWTNMDARLSYGFAPSLTSIIAGRTSMGKSMFKTNLMIQMCLQGIGVMNICPEQGFHSEQNRMASVDTRIALRDMARIREWKKDDPRWQLLKANIQKIEYWNYYVVPSRNITVAGVRNSIRRVRRAGKPVDVVFIDLFDRLKDVNVARDRTGTISVKLNEMALIAAEEKVHLCLLVQINRAPEGRRDKRPTLADLRDCGNYEQDSDLVFLLYRKGYYDRSQEDNILEVHLAKQRDGVSGIILQYLIVDKNTLSIIDSGERQFAE
jgi:replicative DNA helicase